MKKFDSLVCLIRSLSKSEKKHFAVAMTRNGTARQDYAALYRLIVRTDKPDESGIRNAYAKEGGGRSTSRYTISMTGFSIRW